MTKNTYELWSELDKPYAYSGINIFNKETKNKKSLETLASIPTYQKFRFSRRPNQINPYFVRTKRTILQSDLIFMKNPAGIEKDNQGYKYILIVQDTFSRKVWAAPLKDKTADNVLKQLNNIIKLLKPLNKKIRLVIDRGTEYLNKKVKEMLKSHGIQITHPSTGHAAHVERANLSLQRILYQHINHESKASRNWIDFLPQAMHIMNSRHHRIIKMSPNAAELTKNRPKVNEAMSIYRAKRNEKKQKSSSFKVNDLVRIQKLKSKFARGYNQNFTTEIFKIRSVLTHLPVTMYKVSDLNEENIDGSFYASELSAVKGDVFKVEKVLRKKTKRGKPYIFVKWEGFPDSYNSWIEERFI